MVIDPAQILSSDTATGIQLRYGLNGRTTYCSRLEILGAVDEALDHVHKTLHEKIAHDALLELALVAIVALESMDEIQSRG